ncbi:HET-domain-containing protein, partial [Dothidotthia symphoricarpi CBS 119687]
MDDFKHKPINLEEDSFRIIRLFKGKNEPISCELIHARLHDVKDLIEYEALSYTWGDTCNQHIIKVDEKEMLVTENLFLALLHLRYEYEDRILWIDAISIDQNNVKERGHQVRQMGSIYGHAERVVIWLGPATLATDVVMSSMQLLAREANKHACRRWEVSDKRWYKLWSIGQPLSPDSFHEGFIIQQREGMDTLLSRPWFKRVWIIQEVANARSAKVVCGTKSISTHIFAIYPSLLDVEPESHCQAILDIMPGPARNSSWWIENRSLHTLLLKFRGSEATDPRDIVYALIGMSSDGSSTDKLVPDYDKSMEEVVRDTVAFL